VDESKARKLKIGALVILGIVCLAVAVPRFIGGKGKAPKAKPPETTAKSTIPGKGLSTAGAKAHLFAPDPYPVDVGEPTVKDPFSPAILNALANAKPPPSNPFEGEDFSQRDFPWNTTPRNIVTPGGGIPPIGPGSGTGSSGSALRLTGVLKGPKDVAIIRSDTARWYAGIGDLLGGGYRVVSIAQDRVTLSGPAGTKVLVLERS
jgi:hypothetical protein